MVQYIDKDALVEYIKFRYLKHQTGNQPIGCLDKMNEDKEILSYLDTLEVKEVDVNDEISKFIETYYSKAKLGNKLSIRRTAVYFYRLGLKVQKGE